MITALVQMDGVTQVVLTPETPWEVKALDAVPDTGFRIYRGSFYQNCQGGWVREFTDDKSIMFVSDAKEKSSTTQAL